MSRSGFSLIELIVSLSIMTILVGFSVPVIATEVKRQKVKAEKKELNAIKTAIVEYFDDTFAFPSSLDELITNGDGLSGWAGPYYSPSLSLYGSGGSSPTEDEWGTTYTMVAGGVSSRVVTSSGSDHAFGTGDDISVTADVTPVRRKITAEELDVINSAITSYNVTYMKSNPLLPDWTSILARLKATGYLPNGDTTYEKDGWDLPYVADPVGVTPVVRVSSTMFTGGSGGSSTGKKNNGKGKALGKGKNAGKGNGKAKGK